MFSLTRFKVLQSIKRLNRLDKSISFIFLEGYTTTRFQHFVFVYEPLLDTYQPVWILRGKVHVSTQIFAVIHLSPFDDIGRLVIDGL